jgi:hypothetical protein
MKDLLTISIYLHRLFPSLSSLTAGCRDPTERAYWDIVEQLVFAHQKIREGALAETQGQSDSMMVA